MPSKRELLAQKMRGMNNQEIQEKVEEKQPDNIVDELLSNYENGKSEDKPAIQNTPAKTQELPPKTDFINVIDKSHVGRPKTLVGTYKAISARLKMENYVFARKEGAMYGGMNAYINYLIEKDLKRKSKNR